MRAAPLNTCLDRAHYLSRAEAFGDVRRLLLNRPRVAARTLAHIADGGCSGGGGGGRSDDDISGEILETRIGNLLDAFEMTVGDERLSCVALVTGARMNVVLVRDVLSPTRELLRCDTGESILQVTCRVHVYGVLIACRLQTSILVLDMRYNNNNNNNNNGGDIGNDDDDDDDCDDDGSAGVSQCFRMRKTLLLAHDINDMSWSVHGYRTLLFIVANNGRKMAVWEPSMMTTTTTTNATLASSSSSSTSSAAAAAVACDAVFPLSMQDTRVHDHSGYLLNRCRITHGPGNTQCIISTFGGVVLHDSRDNAHRLSRKLVSSSTVKCVASNPHCQFQFAVGDALGLSVFDVRKTRSAHHSTPLLCWDYTAIKGDTLPLTELVFHHLQSEQAGMCHTCVLDDNGNGSGHDIQMNESANG